MKIEKRHILGIVLAVVILVVDFLFLRELKLFYFITGVACVIAALPFAVSLISESSREKENNEMFLEFSRNLVESVKAGTPISKAIINLRSKHYGSLTSHIQKLANQISLGIPVKDALGVFARDVNSSVISRSVTLIGEAEKAGGEIEETLDSVAKSVSQVEDLKKERRAIIYSMVVQGYIIFLVFIVIALIMEFKIFPMTSEIYKGVGGLAGKTLGTPGADVESVSKPLIYLLLVQAFFIGLIIGKLAEGSFKEGIKHSFIMVALSLLIYTGAKAFF